MKIALPAITFIMVFTSHLLYFKIVNSACLPQNVNWLDAYLGLQEHYMGLSYGISAAFAVFAFMKFRACRARSIGAGIGASVWAAALWTLGCFLAGCCGSPMWIVYLNLLGTSTLKIPKWSIVMVTLIMVCLGYVWLRKKTLRERKL